MSDQENVFGKKSYEYAIGRITANRHRPLSAEQWTRVREADIESAGKMVVEYGYSPVTEENSVYDSIEAEMARTVALIREVAPDPELVNLLFFEEDALNLKLFLKARLTKAQPESLPVVIGGIDPEILRICVYTEDFSLLGDAADNILSGITELKDPRKISCRADDAVFYRALRLSEKKLCTPLTRVLKEYGIGRNRITALRIARLGVDLKDYEDAFLTVDWSEYRDTDRKRDEVEVLSDVNRRLAAITEEIGYDTGMGAIANYYFIKKNEASALRMLFTEKSFAAAGGVR